MQVRSFTRRRAWSSHIISETTISYLRIRIGQFPESRITAALREGGLDDEDIDYAAGIILAQAIKAMGGDTRAAEFIRDTSGQKPTDSLQVGNLDNRPFEMIDFSGMNNAQLHEMINARVEEDYE